MGLETSKNHDQQVNDKIQELMDDFDVMVQPTIINVNNISKDDFLKTRGMVPRGARDLFIMTYHTVITYYEKFEDHIQQPEPDED